MIKFSPYKFYHKTNNRQQKLFWFACTVYGGTIYIWENFALGKLGEIGK